MAEDTTTEVIQPKLPFWTKKELDVLKKADVLGFKFVTVGKKVIFANSEMECENDKKKLKEKKIKFNVYIKKPSGWDKVV